MLSKDVASLLNYSFKYQIDDIVKIGVDKFGRITGRFIEQYNKEVWNYYYQVTCGSVDIQLEESLIEAKYFEATPIEELLNECKNNEK